MYVKNELKAIPLHTACTNGHIEIVKFLIDKRGCDPCVRDGNQSTSLHRACANGHITIVTYLIKERKCDPCARASKEFEVTPLHMACQYGHKDIVQDLINTYNCDPCVQDENLSTPMHYACEYGHIGIVKYLTEVRKCDATARNKTLATPLHRACAKGQIKVVRYLVEEKQCDPCAKDIDQATSLHMACESGDIDTVKYLIDKQKCDPNLKDIDLVTPLHIACRYGYSKMVYYLIDCKCDVSVKDVNQFTPLHTACKHGHIDIVRYLIDKQGCDLFSADANQRTLLHFACSKGYIEILDYLINENKCASICIKDVDHVTPLHEAIIGGHIRVIELLMSYAKKCGISSESNCYIKQYVIPPSLVDFNEAKFTFVQVTPLHIACANGLLCIVQHLVEEMGVIPNTDCRRLGTVELACQNGHLNIVNYLTEKSYDYRSLVNGARSACLYGIHGTVEYLINNLNVDPQKAEDKHGNSLLHYAVCGNNLKVFMFLISTGGCNVNKKNYFGDTALHVACKLGQCSIVKYLLSIQCDFSITNAVGKTPLWTVCNSNIIKEFMPYIPMEVCQRIMSDDIEELQALELFQCLVQEHEWDPNEKTSDGDTALHLACNADNLKIVKYMLDRDVNCDPNNIIRNEYGQMPFELTYRSDIIKEFIKQGICPIDLLNNLHISEAQVLQLIKEVPLYSRDDNGLHVITNADGNTALHLACKAKRRTVVKYLFDESGIDWDVNTKNDEGETPIQFATDSDIIRELIKHGANTADVYNYYSSVLKDSILCQTTVKVYIIGDNSVGKSSLVTALQKEESLGKRIVKYIQKLCPKTSGTSSPTQKKSVPSGVKIYEFNSKHFGQTTLYDFNGGRLHLKAHSDWLKSTDTIFSPRVFLVVIDLSARDYEITESIWYWLSSFLKLAPSIKSKIKTIIIGNKSDILCSTDMKTKKSLIDKNLKKILPLSNLELCDFITLDCHSSSSSSMTKLRKCLKVTCNDLRNPKTIAFNAHCFQVYLLDKFRNSESPVTTIRDIQKKMEEDEDSVEENEPLSFLPCNPERLLKLCNELHEKSRVLLFENSTSIDDSWVVINKATLSTHIQDCFESESINRPLSSTGVLSLNSIKEVEQFRTYDPNMLVQFLCHFEYCHEVSNEEMFTQMADKVQPPKIKDRRYFFPALVNCDIPDDIWQSDPTITYHCGWVLHCTHSEQFFSSDFLQAVILRVMFTYPDEYENVQSPIIQRRCSVWKNGIYWGNNLGAESLVEVFDNKRVQFLMRCREANEVKCMQHRSRVIHTIRKCASEFCEGIKYRESFINPSLASKNPSEEIDSSKLYDLECIAKETANLSSIEQPFVQSLTGSLVSLDSLLKFEPYAKLPASIIQEICNRHNPRYITPLSNDFLVRFSEQVKRCPLLMEVVNLDDPTVTVDTLSRKLIEWRDKWNVTYLGLHWRLDQSSIYAGLNILVCWL